MQLIAHYKTYIRYTKTYNTNEIIPQVLLFRRDGLLSSVEKWGPLMAEATRATHAAADRRSRGKRH